ncbi:MAG: allantoicase [Pseudonocardiales bacterium]|jgi:allantoicase|nr:allantoicase [Pseudonocardiales bacterium]
MTDFTAWPEVAARSIGGSVIATSDELFAPADNLIIDGPAVHDATAFSSRGKVYDGWETRRRRQDRGQGVDWAVIRLGAPAVIRGVVVDTAFFTGNFPPFASIEGTTLLGYPSPDEVLAASWMPLLDKTELDGDTANAFAISVAERLITHLRLSIYPDGGVARLRVHGEIVADPRFLGGRIDLAATVHGARITGCSNMFYASPANLIAPGRSRVMSDGWETARRRDDGNDWVTVVLAGAAFVDDVVIDTSRFVGNAPGQVRLTDASTGTELLGLTRLQPDTVHRFPVAQREAVTEVRVDVFPDGGLSRLRVNGRLTDVAKSDVASRWLSLLPPDLAIGIDPATFFD